MAIRVVAQNKPKHEHRSNYYVYVLYLDEANTLPFYVGKGCGIRWLRHRENNEHSGNVPKKNVCAGLMIKFGCIPAAKVAEKLTEWEALAFEAILIRHMGRKPGGPLLNLTNGGNGTVGYRHPEEVIERIRTLNLGKKRPPETGAKIRARHLGRKHTAEVRAAQSAMRKGKKLSLSDEERLRRSSAVKGKHLSEETRSKLRISRTGKLLSEETRAKVGAAQIGRKHSTETKAKIGAAHKGRIFSTHTIEKMRMAARLREARKRASAINLDEPDR